MTPTRRPAGLVLAAGAGTRYGQPKAPVVVDGERLVDRAVRCLAEVGCHPVMVVLGAWLGEVPGAEVIVNTSWSEGMGSSLRAGLAALETRREVGAVVVTLVDLPGMTPAAVLRVAEAPGALVVATFAGRRGHPVRFDREHWNAISTGAVGDEGGRRFLADRTDVTMVEVGDVAEGYDLDVAVE